MLNFSFSFTLNYIRSCNIVGLKRIKLFVLIFASLYHSAVLLRSEGRGRGVGSEGYMCHD